MTNTYEELFEKWEEILANEIDKEGIYDLLRLVNDADGLYYLTDMEDELEQNLIISELCCTVEDLIVDMSIKKAILNDFERTYKAMNDE